MKQKQYPCTSWRLEYVQGNSAKFYEVHVTDSAVCVLRWGRLGTVGQQSTTRYASYEDAHDVGMRQVFSKKAKGYEQVVGDFKFMVSDHAISYALNGNAGEMAREFALARESGEWDGAKVATLRIYEEFAERVKVLMDQAATGDFASTLEGYEQLEVVWEEISDKHAEVSAAMSLAKMTLTQKLMSGSH